MYRSDFEDGENIKEFDKIEQLLFKNVDDKINELSEKFKKEVFNSLSKDIEDYMYERFENIKEKYFDEVINFLLNKKNVYRDKKGEQVLETWLRNCGYSEIEFRKIIFEDNKNIILESITDDMLYERLKNISENSYWRSWNFSDIKTPYPQSNIVSNLLYGLAEGDMGQFNDILEGFLDKNILKKKEELELLKRDVEEIRNKLDNI